MYPWLFRLYGRFPAWSAALLPVLPLTACLVLLLWISGAKGYALGYPVDIAAVNGNEQVVVELVNPLRQWLLDEETGRLVMMEGNRYFGSGAEDAVWIFVQGESRPGGEFSLLQAGAVAAIPNPGRLHLALHLLDKAGEIPLAAIALGGALVMAGPLFIRLAIAILSALVLGTAVWHGMHTAAFLGAIELPPHAIGLLSAFALAAGLMLGLRAQGGPLRGLLERLLLAGLAMAWLPALSMRFGLPEDLALAGAVLLILVSAWFGYALLGAHWIASGLNASLPVTYAVLLVAFFILAALHASAASSRAPVLAWLGKYIDPRTGRIPLSRILANKEPSS